MTRRLLIGLVILIGPVLVYFHTRSNFEIRNADIGPATEPLDIGRLSIHYPDIAEQVQSLEHHQFSLLTMWQDTFVLEYADAEPMACYFYSRCADLVPDTTQEPKWNGSCATNAGFGKPMVYMEHHQLKDSTLELCGVSGDQPFTISAEHAVAERASSIAYGHPKV